MSLDETPPEPDAPGEAPGEPTDPAPAEPTDPAVTEPTHAVAGDSMDPVAAEPRHHALVPRSGSKAILGLVAKGMLAGTLVTSILVGVTELVRARDAGKPSPAPAASPTPPPPVASAASPAASTAAWDPAPPPPPPPPEATDEAPGEPEVEKPPASATPSAAASAPVEPPAPAAQDPSRVVATSDAGTPDERHAFQRAQAAFSRGDMWTAEAALAEYRRSYPEGALAVDAKVLELELLRARPRKAAELQARARAFLDAHPNAPAARRVRYMLERSSGKGQ